MNDYRYKYGRSAIKGLLLTVQLVDGSTRHDLSHHQALCQLP